MTDDAIRAHLGAAADAPVIRLTEPGRQHFVHDCSGKGWLENKFARIEVGEPLCWTPDGNPPATACFVGRCECGAIVVSNPTVS